ncbi:MAG TPA: hypothetical protein VNI01_00365 [Elusimicrobiota bacterium]|jgi:hypothetical protein|nr:hypothetical protein [Elusimicrobiota bacterium]
MRLVAAFLFASFALAPRASAELARPVSPTPGEVHSSPDGRFRWVEGDSRVQTLDPSRAPRSIRLPALPSGHSRRVLFADSGRFFCVVDSEDQEIGLHLGLNKGARDAKALVLRSTIRLMDDSGTVLWSKDTPDAHAVGGAKDARAVRIANNGTLAILLHDVDPYSKERPLLWVLRPSGREALRLDYQSWSRVDEFALSPDGAFLGVRGYGQIPEQESWARAVAVYHVGSGKGWVVPDPSSGPPGFFRQVDAAGWACCLRSSSGFLTFDASGKEQPISKADMWRRFGVAP